MKLVNKHGKIKKKFHRKQIILVSEQNKTQKHKQILLKLEMKNK